MSQKYLRNASVKGKKVILGMIIALSYRIWAVLWGEKRRRYFMLYLSFEPPSRGASCSLLNKERTWGRLVRRLK